MYQLAYVSQEVQDFNADQLTDLLHAARNKNSRLGVTGMLLYRRGSFLQILEGDKDVVADLFLTISSDNRHTNVVQILDRRVPEREFAGWAMRFDRLTDEELEGVNGSFFFKQFTDADFLYEPKFAQRLLLYFKELSS